MEYYRDNRNRIQADMAYRLGVIARQYSELPLPKDKNFSSTLDICILQSLLTNCITLLDAMRRSERRESFLTADLANVNLWGLNPRMIQTNTFLSPRFTAEKILKHIRNALSHPTPIDLEKQFPSTGYTTIPYKSGGVHRYCFISSPDTRENREKRFNTEHAAIEYLERAKRSGTMPDNVTIIRADGDKFTLGLDGDIFARIIKIYLTNIEIHELVMGLSNHLAQPIQEFWDGKTIARLIA